MSNILNRKAQDFCSFYCAMSEPG